MKSPQTLLSFFHCPLATGQRAKKKPIQSPRAFITYPLYVHLFDRSILVRKKKGPKEKPTDSTSAFSVTPYPIAREQRKKPK